MISEGQGCDEGMTSTTRRDKLLGSAGILFGAQSIIAAVALAIAWAASDIKGARDVATLGFQMAGLLVEATGAVMVGLALVGLLCPRTRGVRRGALIAMTGVILAIVAAVLGRTGGDGYFWLDVLVAVLLAALVLPPFAYLAGAFSTEDRETRNNRLGSAATWYAVMAGLALAAFLILFGIAHLYDDMNITLVALLVSLAVIMVAAGVASHAFHGAAAASVVTRPDEPAHEDGYWLVRREGLLLISAILIALVQALLVAAAIVTYAPAVAGDDAAVAAYAFFLVIGNVPLLLAGALAAIAFSGSRRAAMRGPQVIVTRGAEHEA